MPANEKDKCICKNKFWLHFCTGDRALHVYYGEPRFTEVMCPPHPELGVPRATGD